MEARLHAIGATTFATDYTDMPNHLCLDAPAAIAHWRGFSGPYCGKFAMRYSTTTDSAQLKTDDLTSPVVSTKRVINTPSLIVLRLSLRRLSPSVHRHPQQCF